ncbi:MAG TPA: polysaccharide biosynthesis protein, partial [Solirubrobacterales bacterium]|nr:polysaccharide biosynthesis protein [Solirubrobacterales bacterium]
MERLTNPVYRHRLIQIAADSVLIAAAFYLAFRLRFLDAPGGIPDRYQEMLVQSIGFVVLGTLIVFYLSGLYEKWWRYFRLPDMIGVLRGCAISAAILALTFLLLKPFEDQIPRSVVVMEFLLTVFLVGGARAVARMVLVERIARRDAVRGAREVLVVGAGSGGQMVVRELQLNPNLGSRAIAFLDDDPRKRGMRLHGINVLGATDEIGEVLDELTPNEVIIAIPSAPGELRGKVVTACRERDVPVRTLPTVFELLRGGVQLTRQLREVQVEDVLGREPIRMELDRVGAYMQDKVVLVTGAGGSIGAELVRQIARVRPRLLVMLDHAEDNLFQIDREMIEERHFTRVESVLADCKEPDRMLEVMQRFAPDVVFHAAAYKHVPLMEGNPLEAVRNNAIATRVTAETAVASGCERFVLVSTDKAVNPRT